MTEFSYTKHALGVCDICGFRGYLKDLKFNSYGMRVCATDFDKDDFKNHPQNKSPKIQADPLPVEQPRPDVNLALNYRSIEDVQGVPLVGGGGSVFED